MKPKKCQNPSCGKTFTPDRGFQQGCSIPCAIEISRIKQEKKKRKDIARRKQDIMTLPELLAKAQKAFNAYIRERDKNDLCISCQKQPKKRNAGHYRATGGHPELRFEEDNCHLQCEYCNTHLSANLIEYRKNLVNKIGIERVEWLEGPHEPKNYTREEVREIERHFKQKLRELRSK